MTRGSGSSPASFIAAAFGLALAFLAVAVIVNLLPYVVAR